MCVFVFVLVFVQLFETFVVNKDRDSTRLDSTRLDSTRLLCCTMQYSAVGLQHSVLCLPLYWHLALAGAWW